MSTVPSSASGWRYRRTAYEQEKRRQHDLLKEARDQRELASEAEAVRALDNLYVATGWIRARDPELRRLRAELRRAA